MSNEILTEGAHTAEFLLSEGNRQISREQITLAAGAALAAGQILGVITTSGKYTARNPADTGSSATGTATAVAILYSSAPESDEDRPATIIARLAEVAGGALIGLDDTAIAQLAAHYIIVR